MFAPDQFSILQAWGWAVLSSFWQMALLWVVYQSAIIVVKRISSSAKAILATALLIIGFSWFIISFLSAWTVLPASGSENAILFIIENDKFNTWLLQILPVISFIYLLLLIFPVYNFIKNYRYVQNIRKNGLAKADVRWRMFVQKCTAQMGIVKSVQVWMSEWVSSPVTVGYIKPVILLPVAIMTHLSPIQAEAVLLHELAHIRRTDYLVNLISKIIQCILYFNPFVKALTGIINREREKHCDEIVLQFQYEPQSYASALLELEKASHTACQMALAASGNKKNELLGRIEIILGLNRKPVYSFQKIAGIVIALLCFLSMNEALSFTRQVQRHNTSSGVLNTFSTPLHFTTTINGFISATSKTGSEIPLIEKTVNVYTPPLVTKVKTSKNKKGAVAVPILSDAVHRPYKYVAFYETAIPELNDIAEQQVKDAISTSKKIILEKQWKLVENDIADVMTSEEKEKLKYKFEKVVNNLDWDRIENNVRLAYGKINWDRVNNILSKAIVESKLDSLQRVYLSTATKLICLEKELENKDKIKLSETEMILEELTKKRTETLRIINVINLKKSGKIIQL